MNSLILERYHGDSLVLPVSVKDDDGNPINLTDATIRFTIDSPTPITDQSPGYSISRVDLYGVFTIAISADKMATLAPGSYRFDVELTYASGVRETLFVGILAILEDVTQ